MPVSNRSGGDRKDFEIRKKNTLVFQFSNFIFHSMENLNAEVPFSTNVFCSVDGKFISSSYVFFMNYTNGFDFEKKFSVE